MMPRPDVSIPGLVIRPARAFDRRAWRMLLPEVARGADPCRVLVALAPWPVGPTAASAPLRVVGAVAATEHHVMVPVRGPKVLPHVIAPLRRQGIGRALVDAMAAHVLAAAAFEGRDPQVLHAWSPLDPGDPGLQAWHALGFTGRGEAWVHELDLHATERWLKPVYERTLPAIPPDARIVFLADATPEQKEQVAALHVRHLGGRPREVGEAVGGPTPYFRGRSILLLRGEAVVGFALSRDLPETGVVSVEANVLEPEYRMGWANVLLKYEGARRLLAIGIGRARFQTYEHHADTRGFARRSGDAVTRRLLWPHRPLRPPG